MKWTRTVIGYPYIGEDREWKRCLEAFWRGEVSEETFLDQLKQIRLSRLKRQMELGIDVMTVGDFTLYDRMLDTAFMFGMIPARYSDVSRLSNLSLYYAMARGEKGAVACEMTKWFNTNYHYIVPEYDGQELYITNNRLLDWFKEARDELGVVTKPTMIGPYTFIKLAKGYDDWEVLAEQLIPLYSQVIAELIKEGAEWVQLEEPALVLTLDEEEVAFVKSIYEKLAAEKTAGNIMLQTYFEGLSVYEELIHLPVDGIGLDFVSGYLQNMTSMKQFGFPAEKVLAIGIVDGRNIWKADLVEKAELIQSILEEFKAAEIWVQPSCSLQHVPVSASTEQKMDGNIKGLLAFADEKIKEIDQLVTYFEKPGIVLGGNGRAVKPAVTGVTLESEDFKRSSPYPVRRDIQAQKLNLPIFPTTTIGSFPQSKEVKETRKAWRNKIISDESYEAFIARETERWIRIQEDLELDVLVHGEFERTDMVEYFGEKLDGFALSEKAWVVSYGSRCVKPPIIYGDVKWLEPMTLKETAAAQAMTEKPVKGMLTGPVTILNWSFVRDDIPRKDVANQLALALRKEIDCLEQAGITIIQVDEPALREGLPLRMVDWQEYLTWAIPSFRLATSGVQDETQIHTHMCYCDFHDFVKPIEALDVDVISIETSRSHGEFIQSLQHTPYEKGIGLGVYDIHSPRIPSTEEMLEIMQDSLEVLEISQFWVNPDCGLKTRREEETVASLRHMVSAAKQLRSFIKMRQY